MIYAYINNVPTKGLQPDGVTERHDCDQKEGNQHGPPWYLSNQADHVRDTSLFEFLLYAPCRVYVYMRSVQNAYCRSTAGLQTAARITCDQASLYFRCGKVRLIQTLDCLSDASPESGLFSDWSRNKRYLEQNKISVSLACYWQIGSKSTKSNQKSLRHLHFGLTMVLACFHSLLGSHIRASSVRCLPPNVSERACWPCSFRLSYWSRSLFLSHCSSHMSIPWYTTLRTSSSNMCSSKTQASIFGWTFLHWWV